MAERRIIAVAGATGAQGGGVVRAILADPEGGFSVRAITRFAATHSATRPASVPSAAPSDSAPTTLQSR